MSVTCKFNGRLGNILFNMCQVIAHVKRYNLTYAFPTDAWACIGGICPITIPATGPMPTHPSIYNEPQDTQGHPYYHDIPNVDNVVFHGYYQSFRYFDDYRQDILDAINLPWTNERNIVGMHVRRGDCIAQPDAFPMAPMQYYQAAIDYMLEHGQFHFRIFSDDIPWCRQQFTNDNFPGCIFEFMEGGTDVEDFIALSSCQHQIIARSTFSLMAGWFNQSSDKIVLVPSIDQHYWWKGQNRNLLDSSFITQINW